MPRRYWRLKKITYLYIHYSIIVGHLPLKSSNYMKQYFSFLAGFILCVQASVLKAQNVHIPDQTFKNYLFSKGVDTNQDFEIQVSEAQNYTGVINIAGLAITDLTGLEEFTSIQILSCEDVPITSLNVSANVMLTHLRCSNNPISSLDLSHNINLVSLTCQRTNITHLDLSNNVNLTELDCRSDSSLVALDIRNGNNTSMTNFLVNGNPLLQCIEVDDSTYSTTNWTSIDPNTYFSTNCFYLGTTEALEKNKIQAHFYPNPMKNALTIDLGTTFSSIKVTISNPIGQLLQTNTYTNQNRLDLNIQGLPGWYFIQIETEKGNQTIKVLKQ